jgi:hypothetical protein
MSSIHEKGETDGRCLLAVALFPLGNSVKSRQGRRHKLSRPRRDKAGESAGGAQVRQGRINLEE